MKTLTVKQAQDQLPDVLHEVAQGEDVNIQGDGITFKVVVLTRSATDQALSGDDLDDPLVIARASEPAFAEWDNPLDAKYDNYEKHYHGVSER